MPGRVAHPAPGAKGTPGNVAHPAAHPGAPERTGPVTAC